MKKFTISLLLIMTFISGGSNFSFGSDANKIIRNIGAGVLLLGIAKAIDQSIQGSNASSSNLPKCPPSGYRDNCFGSYVYPSGHKYTGEWRDNKRHGQGTHTNTRTDGTKYVGEWKDNKKHGQGTLTWSNAKQGNGKYVGEWKDNQRHRGTTSWKGGKWDGNKYVGEYKWDKRHGKGTYTRTDGTKYVGGFKEDKRHGQGTLTHANGAISEGVWEYDKFKATLIEIEKKEKQRIEEEIKEIQHQANIRRERERKALIKHQRSVRAKELLAEEKSGIIDEEEIILKIKKSAQLKIEEREKNRRVELAKISRIKQSKKDKHNKKLGYLTVKQVKQKVSQPKKLKPTPVAKRTVKKILGFNSGPPQQKYMSSLITATVNKNKTLATQAQQQYEWIKTSKTLCQSALFKAHSTKRNWVGFVKSIRMNDSGTLDIEIRIDNHRNTVLAYNQSNSFGDSIIKLRSDELVQFSGFFKPGNSEQNECLDGGFTASPDMVRESFRFTFTEIKPAEYVNRFASN